MLPAVSIQLAKRWEGFHRKVQYRDGIGAAPYLCPAGFWTIAWGHLCTRDHPIVTEAEGEEYLRMDLTRALHSTLVLCPVLATEPENRLAAIVDFTFNLGSGRLKNSTLRRRVNQRDWDESAKELRRWVYGGGVKLPGLVARREEEVALLLSGER